MVVIIQLRFPFPTNVMLITKNRHYNVQRLNLRFVIISSDLEPNLGFCVLFPSHSMKILWRKGTFLDFSLELVKCKTMSFLLNIFVSTRLFEDCFIFLVTRRQWK